MGEYVFDSRICGQWLLGDRAAALVWMAQFRQSGQDLTYIEKAPYQDLDYAFFCNHFGVKYELMPTGRRAWRNIYHGSVWEHHKTRNQEREYCLPCLPRPDDLPEEYVAVFPTHAARYNTFRNIKLDWWQKIEAPLPIVQVLHESSVMRALAIVNHAKVVVTGDSAMGHWAVLWGVPLVSVCHIRSKRWQPQHYSTPIERPKFANLQDTNAAITRLIYTGADYVI